MQRRAVIAGVSAFLAVFVSGTVLVSLLRHADAAGGSASPSASSTTPTSPQAEPGPSVDAYVAWVPGGLPPGYGARVAALTTIGQIAVVAADNIWMTSSSDKSGALVDQPASPYMIPIDATAIDPGAYAKFLPPETRAVVSDLQVGQGILGQTSARLRHIGPGGVMRFLGGASVTIVGVLPDQLVGAAELVVTRATGATIGISHNRYLLFQPSAGLRPADGKLEKRFRGLLPPGLRYPVVQVRAPGETKYLRMGDGVLPQALIKKRFGEWAGRPQPGNTGSIEIDPVWIQEQIVTVTLPVLGRVSCNKKLIPQLRATMDQVVASGLGATIHEFDACFSPGSALTSPSGSISHHAWGAAIDINADVNRLGTPPVQDPALVGLMKRWGFAWGGDWIVAEGTHFEYLHTPSGT